MATQKRFVYYEHKGADYILDTPNKSLDFIEMLGDCLEAEEIVDLLNCLNDENEQLKRSVQYWYAEHKRIVNNYVDKIKEVEKENEQLKQENEKLQGEYDHLLWLYNGLGCEYDWLKEENEQLKQFKKKVFVLIDKEITRNEEAIERGKETGADSSSMGFYNHMLKRLKKELSE